MLYSCGILQIMIEANTIENTGMGCIGLERKTLGKVLLGSNTNESLSFASYCFIESLIRHVYMDGHLFKIQKPAFIEKKVLQITLK